MSGYDRGYGGGRGDYGREDRRGGYEDRRGGYEDRRGGHGGRGGFGGGRDDRQFGDLAPVDWQSVALAPIRKDFYTESAATAALSEEQVAEHRRLHEMKIDGSARPRPALNFEDCGFPDDVMERIRRAGFDKPSPIQTQSWPVLLSGHDMIGIAETGSGKTLSFLLPAVIHIRDQEPLRRGDGPICLILAPTRELVEQIKDEAVKFAARMRVGVAYGGAPKRHQLYALRDGCEIVAACPGRLIDFLETRACNLHRCTYLVLDEADRMLDMGFEPQIRKIVGQIRPDRQTLMFSATWPKEVQGLARDLCNQDPVRVTIGSAELKANHNVTQIVEVVRDGEKPEKVQALLSELQNQDPSQRIIIFAETKRTCDVLERELKHSGHKVLAIHGDKEQNERRYVLDQFKKGIFPIMVATDVAARGLDVKDVKVVINYDMSNQIEDYVHRIGRTGRAGATGVAYTFITDDRNRLARDLVNILKEAHQQVPAALEELAFSGRGGGFGGRGNFRRGPPRGGPRRRY